jgi:hypothetical protein
MAILTVTPGINIEDGMYDAVFLGLEVCEPTEKSQNKKAWLKWMFSVFDGVEEKDITAASSCALGPKAKGRPWVEALVGRRLEPGEQLNTDTDIPAPTDCRLVIRNDAETGFARVMDVLPARPQRQATKPAPQSGGGVTV